MPEADIDQVWAVPVGALADPGVTRALVRWAEGHNPDLAFWFRATCDHGEQLRDELLRWEKETRRDS